MEDIFRSHIDDLCDRAGRGELAFSAFMNAAEARRAREYLASLSRERWLLLGGYPAAERVRLFVFPSWLEPDQSAAEEYITPLRISGSGYAELDHRAFLGSLTGAGFSRDVIGDIVVEDKSAAVVFFDEKIARLLLETSGLLERVGRDKVKISAYTLPHGFGSQGDYTGISGTLASARLDCVISELCSLSREKAKEQIRRGLVSLNYEQAGDSDAGVASGDIISVRGFGKFRIVNIDERTKKDRIRLTALKYV